MHAAPLTLTGVMKSAERFVIPEYQRPYSWTEEEVEQLWNDISEAYDDSKTATSGAVGADDYFLGPVVVAKRRLPMGEVSAVVDGQQRLTTLHTVLWCASTARPKQTRTAADERLRVKNVR
jgi:uncharacterized protein with ParB-like and HNH nuclease domain